MDCLSMFCTSETKSHCTSTLINLDLLSDTSLWYSRIIKLYSSVVSWESYIQTQHATLLRRTSGSYTHCSEYLRPGNCIYKVKSLVILNMPHMKYVCTSMTWQNIGGTFPIASHNQIIGGTCPPRPLRFRRLCKHKKNSSRQVSYSRRTTYRI